MWREKIIIDKQPGITYYWFTELRYSDRESDEVWRILRKDSSVSWIDNFQYPDWKDSYFYVWDDRYTYTYK